MFVLMGQTMGKRRVRRHIKTPEERSSEERSREEDLTQPEIPQLEDPPHQGRVVSRERTRVRTAHANFKCADRLFWFGLRRKPV